ncbi:hypothetical protein [Bradyrhizobium sp. STM 3557]|uniref:hypothetical protein n=1 Tax=Bradyrhizobium sp. STM 3557 TaxID=578920 RepID=UPI00388D1429
MIICFREPTIDELLDDSLTQGLMRADGVDAAALRSMLYGLASSIGSRLAVRHDRISPNEGVNAGILASADRAAFQHGAPNKTPLSAISTRPSSLCTAC